MWAGPMLDVDIEDRLDRLSFNPIFRAHLDRRLDEGDRAARYGSLLTHYQLCDLGEAEFGIVPRFYERTDPRQFRAMLDAASKRGLRTIVFGTDDLEPLMKHDSIVLLHPGPTRGAQPFAESLAVPYFFNDRTGGVESRLHESRPSVAFCGQGSVRPGLGALHGTARAFAWAKSRAKPRTVVPPVRGHVSLRSTALEALRSHPMVDDRFIVRDQYRAGATTDAERLRSQAEFDDNLRSARYALCVRGTGNFSARFYEALSFGCVPLFVDTDCVLPFEDQIDWGARTVWVDETDVGSIGDRLVMEHSSATGDPDRSANALRTLWEDWLTQDGYFRHLAPVLRNLL
jgi:hypothetical protein